MNNILDYKKNINKMWKIEKEIENSYMCPECNKNTLVGASPFDLLFICSSCGNFFGVFDIDNIVLQKFE